MKITIIHKGTTVIIDETDHKDKSTMRYSDQNEYVQKTITSVINDINNSKK